jgi:DNA-binding response OmpR family regulator
LVDDDKGISRSLTNVFKRSGLEIESAHSGQEAMLKTREKCYPLIIVDNGLPDMLGTELLKELNKTQPQAIKIMLTGTPTVDETAVDAAILGVDAYLLKPVHPSELLSLIKEKLAKKP